MSGVAAKLAVLRYTEPRGEAVERALSCGFDVGRVFQGDFVDTADVTWCVLRAVRALSGPGRWVLFCTNDLGFGVDLVPRSHVGVPDLRQTEWVENTLFPAWPWPEPTSC